MSRQKGDKQDFSIQDEESIKEKYPDYENYWIKKHFQFGIKAVIGGTLIEINTRID